MHVSSNRLSSTWFLRARVGVFGRLVGRSLLTAILIVVATFWFLQLTPGDLADVMGSEAGGASAEAVSELRERYGIDKPAIVQFGYYLRNLAYFDMGYSFRFGGSVTALIINRLPATLLLMGATLVLAIVVGVAMGALAALHPRRPIDIIVTGFSTLAFALPSFWLGLMLIVLFAIELRWLPAGGMRSFFVADGIGAAVLDTGRHLILPAVTLAIHYAGIYARLTRTAMLEVKDLDYVRSARARGLKRTRIALGYILRNALLPVVTMTGLQVGTLFSGVVVVETIFGWPGIGRLAYDAVLARDHILVLGIVVFSSFVVILSNILTDLIYSIVDPRMNSNL